MKTLMIVASLFSAQPAPVQMDTQWLELQSMRDQVRTYLTEDVARVSQVIKNTLQDGIHAGTKLYDSMYEPAALVANKESTNASEEQPNYQVN